MPGMDESLGVEVPCGGWQYQPLAERQGCPSRGGIRRKPEAKSRPDEQNISSEAGASGRACNTKRSPILPRGANVDEAGIWDEGARSYPGRSGGTLVWVPSIPLNGGHRCCARRTGSPGREVRLSRQKSAEAIVAGGGRSRRRAERQGEVAR